MPTTPGTDRLADRRYVTLILRLTLDQRDQLLDGEIVEAVSGRRSRFVGWRGVMPTIRAFLGNPEQGGRSDDTPGRGEGL